MGNRKITDVILVEKSNKSSSSNPVEPSSSQCSQSSSDVLPVRELPYGPSKSFIFHKTKVGEGSRSCQHQWYEPVPWLHYDTLLAFVC